MVTENRLIGRSVRRKNGVRLVAGRGFFLDDVKLPMMLYASFVRSPYAHALIKRIDLQDATRLSSVKAVLTGEDVVKDGRTFPLLYRPPGVRIPRQFCLAAGKVRYVGEPVVALAVDDRYMALDAAELVSVEYEPLPAVLDVEEAVKTDVKIYEEIDDNVYQHKIIRAGNPEEALNSADFVVEKRFRIHRQAGAPLEPHGIVAHYDRLDGTLTVWSATQIPHGVRMALSLALDIPQQKIKVIARDVGGGFGNYKYHPEDIAVCLLSMKTGLPVKWVASRRELFLSGYHAREQVHYAKVGFDKSGRILALQDRMYASVGAYLARETTAPPLVTALMLPGPYDIRNVLIELYCVAVNKSTSSAYRGFGQPEANFVMERIVDIIARELNLEPAEVRMRNMIKREQFPYRAATGLLYDSGDFQSVLRKAVESIDFDSRGSNSCEDGKLRGVGMAFYVEVTGFGPAKTPSILGTVHGGHESVTLRFDPDGGVSIFTGLMPHGQGAETTLAQVAADLLGLELDDVKIIYGNTEECPYGHGTFGSRSAVVGSNAIFKAVNAIKEKARNIAAHMLEVNEEDLEYDSGVFYVKEAREKAVHIKDVARLANLGLGLPEEVEPGLEVTVFYDPRGWTISYGAHIVQAEIDLETCSIRIPRYLVVHDCGRILNPAVVDGQIQGGAAQGIGGALLEEIVYDDRGQLLTTTFMDYALPTAVELPNFTIKHVETYSTANPLGVRGAGEGATIPSAAAIASAVENALKGFNIEIVSTPLNPGRLWKIVKKPDPEHL